MASSHVAVACAWHGARVFVAGTNLGVGASAAKASCEVLRELLAVAVGSCRRCLDALVCERLSGREPATYKPPTTAGIVGSPLRRSDASPDDTSWPASSRRPCSRDRPFLAAPPAASTDRPPGVHDATTIACSANSSSLVEAPVVGVAGTARDARYQRRAGHQLAVPSETQVPMRLRADSEGQRRRAAP